MKNRAKCKLCKSIIESFHLNDFVVCKCGEISITGGNDEMKCGAKNWENFLRVDDNGNDIVVKVKENDKIEAIDENKYQVKLSKKDLIDMLEEKVKSIETLPAHAMGGSINHYDFCSLLILLTAIFKADSD